MSKIRKEVHLEPSVVEAIQEKADADNRSFKQYLELFIKMLSEGKVIMIKK